MFFHCISLISSKFSPNNVFFSVTGLMGLSMQTLQKQEWTEFPWRNNVHNAKFSKETRLEHGFAIEYISSNDCNCFQ